MRVTGLPGHVKSIEVGGCTPAGAAGVPPSEGAHSQAGRAGLSRERSARTHLAPGCAAGAGAGEPQPNPCPPPCLHLLQVINFMCHEHLKMDFANVGYPTVCFAVFGRGASLHGWLGPRAGGAGCRGVGLCEGATGASQCCPLLGRERRQQGACVARHGSQPSTCLRRPPAVPRLQHVTFISGTNGSGKSAVLQALQCCLGVKASSTGRTNTFKKVHGVGGTGSDALDASSAELVACLCRRCRSPLLHTLRPHMCPCT